MKFFEFLEQISQTPPQKGGVFLLRCAEYPVLCAARMVRLLRERVRVTVALDASADELAAHGGMGFLGEPMLVWCGDLATRGTAGAQACVRILEEHHGPNTMLAWHTGTCSSSLAGTTMITVPENVTIEQAQKIAQYLFGNSVPQDPLLSALFEGRAEYPLDVVCHVLEYQSVLGRNREQFIKTWMPRLIRERPSLFDLSTKFFARNEKMFWHAWYAVCDAYGPEFWLVYWAEQFWQALTVVQNGGAKGKTSRLPFSFYQRDWRKHTQGELAAACTALYELDYRFKNGERNGAAGIEIILLKYLQSRHQ